MMWRGNGALADVPIMAVTPYAMVGKRETDLAAGCTGCIGKPIDPALFVEEIAGFIEPGQQLRVMYDAFPYQHFGTHRARVVSVANDLVYAGEDTGPFSINTHAYLTHAYLAIAHLESETIETNNRSIPLRHGMSLKADILLEKRTLLNWLLEPIHSLRRRT